MQKTSDIIKTVEFLANQRTETLDHGVGDPPSPGRFMSIARESQRNCRRLSIIEQLSIVSRNITKPRNCISEYTSK